MTHPFPALGFILLFPAIGVVFNLFIGPRAGRAAVNWVGAGVVFIALGFSAWAFFTLLSLPAGSALAVTLWPWIHAGRFHVDISLRMDALSAVMALVVSGVGAFIHLYSCGYMAHDEDYARYFAYMNLFALSMLILVLAANLVLMFVGWEGVGMCSYLLIAFWYANPEFAYNGRKAFVVNRVGDAAFLIGMFLLIATLGAHGVWTLNFAVMQAHDSMLGGIAVVAGILLFVGATGKSAQLPLYVWLPDAMVGPTPVSALIHAATMVTAGVYMVARLHFLYTLGPDAMEVVAIVGTITAFFAATIAIVQPDIKRVLAYSTISQLGYMFMGVGVGAFSAGIFHVMTHAFFKGLLFLCAGSVIHALGGEQDMNKMGGLRVRLPITYLTMLAATLAICAIPPFAGFFSKDLILESAYTSGNTGLWVLGIITAGLTGFYMFRLIFLTFHGTSRVEPDKLHHVHESPPTMAIPMIVLGILCIIGGWIDLPEHFLWGNAFTRFLAPVVGSFKPVVSAPPFMLSGISLIVAIIGIIFAWVFYIQLPGLPMLVAWRLKPLYDFLYNKYFIDQLYDWVVTRPLFFGSNVVLNRGVDHGVIDATADGIGTGVEDTGQEVRRVETGNVQHYAFAYLIGAVCIAAYYLYLVMR